MILHIHNLCDSQQHLQQQSKMICDPFIGSDISPMRYAVEFIKLFYILMFRLIVFLFEFELTYVSWLKNYNKSSMSVHMSKTMGCLLEFKLC
jgi:hypothetical protein